MLQSNDVIRTRMYTAVEVLKALGITHEVLHNITVETTGSSGADLRFRVWVETRVPETQFDGD